MLNRIKLWFHQLLSGSEKRPKIPRKKLSIQFQHVKTEFETLVAKLEQTISRPDLARSTIMLGKLLFQDVRRFQELHLIRINENRINTVSQPLLHPVDFSLWVINQMHAYAEEIYHYIKTVEAVDL